MYHISYFLVGSRFFLFLGLAEMEFHGFTAVNGPTVPDPVDKCINMSHYLNGG